LYDAAGRPRRSSLGYSTDPLEFFGIGWGWIAITLATHSHGSPVGHGVGRRWYVFRPGNDDRLREPRCDRGSVDPRAASISHVTLLAVWLARQYLAKSSTGLDGRPASAELACHSV